jgi:hypothetical protein
MLKLSETELAIAVKVKQLKDALSTHVKAPRDHSNLVDRDDPVAVAVQRGEDFSKLGGLFVTEIWHHGLLAVLLEPEFPIDLDHRREAVYRTPSHLEAQSEFECERPATRASPASMGRDSFSVALLGQHVGLAGISNVRSR